MAVEDVACDGVELLRGNAGHGYLTYGSDGFGDHTSNALETLELLGTVHRHERSLNRTNLRTRQVAQAPCRTTLDSGSPRAKRASCSAPKRTARSSAAAVSPALCGVIASATCQSGWSSGNGSGSTTSRTARSRPDSSSATSAAVSTTPPRPALSSSAPSRIRAS